MKLHCLGTGGYHPSERRHTPCYYLPDHGIVLDAGTGLFRLPQQLKTQPTKALDIFLTHAHLDHIVGLTYLLQIPDVERITVHAEEAKIEAIKEHLFAEPLFPVVPAVAFRPLAGPVETGSEATGCRVSWFSLRHPGGSVGYRLDCHQQSLAYVTDTTADEHAPYVDHIRNVDLLIHECNFFDHDRAKAELTGHSCVSDVGKVARACSAQQLLLIHINPLIESDDELLAAARKVFPNTEIAEDRLSFDIA